MHTNLQLGAMVIDEKREGGYDVLWTRGNTILLDGGWRGNFSNLDYYLTEGESIKNAGGGGVKVNVLSKSYHSLPATLCREIQRGFHESI
jgi:hypothetical protein